MIAPKKRRMTKIERRIWVKNYLGNVKRDKEAHRQKLSEAYQSRLISEATEYEKIMIEILYNYHIKYCFQHIVKRGPNLSYLDWPH